MLSIDWPTEKTTINSDYYISELEEFREVIKRERRRKLSKGTLFQHDNARPHVSYQTKDAIRRLGFECLPHPPTLQSRPSSDRLLVVWINEKTPAG